MIIAIYNPILPFWCKHLSARSAIIYNIIAHSEVVFTTLPIHFFQRDNWASMETKELRVQRSQYDLASPQEKADLLNDLMVVHAKKPEEKEGKKRKNITTSTGTTKKHTHTIF